MTKVRLFVGIGLPQEYQERVALFTERLGKGLRSKVRWQTPGNWHLTLKFLGDTDEQLVDDITERLNGIKQPAFAMQAGQAGVFPRVQHPREIWLGLQQGREESVTLAKTVNDALEPLGIAREKKEFRPHLTIGRVKKLSSDDWEGVLAEAGREQWPQFVVDRFTLWRSELNPTGAVHTPVEEFLLT